MRSPASDELKSRADYLLQIMPRIGKSMQKALGLQHKAYAQSLTPRQLAILHHLADHGPSSMRDLSHYYGVTMPTMTDIVGRLVALKLVKRGRQTSDRRIVQIQITAVGEREFRQIYRNAQDFFVKLLARLKPAEQRKLIDAFEVIERILVKPAEV